MFRYEHIKNTIGKLQNDTKTQKIMDPLFDIYHKNMTAVSIFSSNAWKQREEAYFPKCQTLLLTDSK